MNQQTFQTALLQAIEHQTQALDCIIILLEDNLKKYETRILQKPTPDVSHQTRKANKNQT